MSKLFDEGGVRLEKETQFDYFCRVIVPSWYFCIDTTFLEEDIMKTSSKHRRLLFVTIAIFVLASFTTMVSAYSNSGSFFLIYKNAPTGNTTHKALDITVSGNGYRATVTELSGGAIYRTVSIGSANADSGAYTTFTATGSHNYTCYPYPSSSQYVTFHCYLHYYDNQGSAAARGTVERR